MDFGVFIVEGLDALGVLLLAPYVVYVLVERKSFRFFILRVWAAMGAFLVVGGLFIYKVYYLDEGLVVAVMNRDRAQAAYLLAHGADPNTKDEGGATAMQIARRNGLTNLVTAMKAAGGKE